MQALLLPCKRVDDHQLCCWQQLRLPYVCLQRRLLWRRSSVFILQDLLCCQLSISVTVHSWQFSRHCRLHLQRWILWISWRKSRLHRLLLQWLEFTYYHELPCWEHFK
jgi:hypothetical protein